MNDNNEKNPAGDPQADLVRDAMKRFAAILALAAMRIEDERAALLADYEAEDLGKPETPLRSVAAAVIVDVSADHVITETKEQARKFLDTSDRAAELLDDFLREKGDEIAKIKAEMAKKTAKKAAEKKGADHE